MVPKFVKVMPRDYKRVLQAIQNALASGLSGDDALDAAFEENSRDVARIGGVRRLDRSPVESGILVAGKLETEQVASLLERRDL
jgi:hypothetical protein